MGILLKFWRFKVQVRPPHSCQSFGPTPPPHISSLPLYWTHLPTYHWSSSRIQFTSISLSFSLSHIQLSINTLTQSLSFYLSLNRSLFPACPRKTNINFFWKNCFQFFFDQTLKISLPPRRYYFIEYFCKGPYNKMCTKVSNGFFELDLNAREIKEWSIRIPFSFLYSCRNQTT